jgi:hypothetical protein
MGLRHCRTCIRLSREHRLAVSSCWRAKRELQVAAASGRHGDIPNLRRLAEAAEVDRTAASRAILVHDTEYHASRAE